MDPATHDERSYYLQPIAGGLPRSVKELREALDMLTKTQVADIVLAETKSNYTFASKVFEAFDEEIFMRLNTTYDFDHLVQALERDMIRFHVGTPSIEQPQAVLRICGEVEDIVGTMKIKAAAEYASDGTKASAVFNMCKIGKLAVQAKSQSLDAALVLWLRDGRAKQLVQDMMEVLACMGSNQLYKMVETVKDGGSTFVDSVAELKNVWRDRGISASPDEIIEVLKSSADGSSDEDLDDDSSMKEDTPTTPPTGASMSVLFMDD